jgi:colanic acid biosynthesis glycosyl transferase WcaI
VLFRSAQGIGVISGGFARNIIAKGVPAEKVALLPNSIGLDFMKPMEKNNGFRQQHDIKPSDFVVMYSGSIALKQGLHTLVEAASEFHATDGVQFYLVGEGPYLQELEARAKELCLPHFHFLPLQPKENLPVQLSAADALVITQKRAVTDMVFPGKLLYYMGAGRPILAAVSPDSETGRFINKHQVGIVVPPEEPQALAEAIRYLRSNPNEIERLGKNGRRVVEEYFDRRVVLEKITNYFEGLVKTSHNQSGYMIG